MNELSLFAGVGGGILGTQLLGIRTICAVEIEPYCREVLLRRQRDGVLPMFPIWDDIRTFDGKPWKGVVDVVSGGFPCQDISISGKGIGLNGERSRLWWEMARVVDEIRPKFVFIENTAHLIRRGLRDILDDLKCKGYGGSVTAIPSLFFGTDHIRNRIWIIADSEKKGWSWRWYFESPPKILESNGLGEKSFWERANKSGIVGISYGLSNGVDRLKSLGNAQVPAVAAGAFRALVEREGLVTSHQKI